MPMFNGTAGNDVLTGTSEPDIINGLAGEDQVSGLGGNDQLNGGADADMIDGGAGNDLLIGGGGVRYEWNGAFAAEVGDTLMGGVGNDTYVVSQWYDRIVEAEGAGDDVLLVATPEFILLPAVEIETIVAADGTEPIRMWGNGYAQSIYGNDGNNVIIGGGGLDYLLGGAGDDQYFISSPTIIRENSGAGFDFVSTTVSFALPEHVENLSGTGSDDINLTGNDLANEIHGNSGNNLISGGGGGDVLYGYNPTSSSSADGNDVLDGGRGADQMRGGQGNDVYIVDDASDQVFESQAGGDDVISTNISFNILPGVWVETLAALESAGAVTLAGNGFANSIYGNASNNILIGGGGLDHLSGGRGDDIYYLSSDSVTGFERITESASGGHDIAYAAGDHTLYAGAHVEILSAFPQIGTAPLNLTGNEFANHVIGSDGANILNGAGGNDVFSGRGGADIFLFDQLGEENADRVLDFTHGADKIGLEDSVFVGLEPGALSSDAFCYGRFAQDASHRIIYDPTSGNLWFDPDGTGAAPMVNFAVITAGNSLTADDFIVM